MTGHIRGLVRQQPQHGVGYFLNVHEGPHNISPAFVDEPFHPGQVVTNEPGVYIEGEYGIRIENIMGVKSLESNEEGEFLGFEALTLAPIDTRPIVVEKMDQVDLDYLNNYHREVYEKLSPGLDEAHCAWLEKACAPIG